MKHSEDLVEKVISPILFDTDPSFNCSFFNQIIVYRSFYGAPLTFCLFGHAFSSRLLGPCLLV